MMLAMYKPTAFKLWKMTSPEMVATTYTDVPAQFPFGPLQIIVSPYVDYDATAQTTTIYLVDRNELGYLIEDEAVTSEEWDDPARDIRKMKFRERYAVAAPVDKRIRSATNISISKAYHFEDRMTWQAGTGTLPTI